MSRDGGIVEMYKRNDISNKFAFLDAASPTINNNVASSSSQSAINNHTSDIELN